MVSHYRRWFARTAVWSALSTCWTLVDFYSTQYRAMYDGVPAADEESALRTLEELWVGVDLHRKLQIAYPELSFGPDSLVCEVGTWAGANLASFDRAGVPVVGCDFDESYLEYGRKRGLNLVRGSIPELREEGVQADLVFLSHVLEHILDPVGFMRSCRDIVVPGGHVYIVVPGLRSLSFGYSEGELLGTLQNVHSFLFELETLRLVMAQAGFTLVKGDEWCSALFRRDDNFDPPPQSSIPVRGPAVLRLIGGLRRSRPFWKFVHRALGGDYYSSVSRIARYGAYALRHPFWGVDFLRQQMVLRQ